MKVAVVPPLGTFVWSLIDWASHLALHSFRIHIFINPKNAAVSTNCHAMMAISKPIGQVYMIAGHHRCSNRISHCNCLGGTPLHRPSGIIGRSSWIHCWQIGSNRSLHLQCQQVRSLFFLFPPSMHAVSAYFESTQHINYYLTGGLSSSTKNGL